MSQEASISLAYVLARLNLIYPQLHKITSGASWDVAGSAKFLWIVTSSSLSIPCHDLL